MGLCWNGEFHAIIDPSAGTIDAVGYRAELWGRLGQEGDPQALVSTPSGSAWGRVDRARVRYLADPLGCYLDACRGNDGALEISLRGIEHCTTFAQAQRALDGLPLLKDLLSGKRRIESHDFLADCRSAARRVSESHARLTVDSLVRYLPYERSTFYDFLDETHWSWRELKHLLITESRRTK